MIDATLPETGFIRISKVVRLIPVSRTTIWNWVREGKFPQPIRLSAATTVWRAEDIRAYLDAHGAGRGQSQAAEPRGQLAVA